MDISNLYRQVIMDHYKSPKNKGLVNDSEYMTVHMNNPSCGDDIVVQYKVENDVITDVKHQRNWMFNLLFISKCNVSDIKKQNNKRSIRYS